MTTKTIAVDASEYPNFSLANQSRGSLNFVQDGKKVMEITPDGELIIFGNVTEATKALKKAWEDLRGW